MARKIELKCPKEMIDIICAALRNYAQAAFPDSSSPCQMVSRDSLLTAAKDIQQQYEQVGTGLYSSRMRAMMKAAINYHFKVVENETQSSAKHQCGLIMLACKGEHVTDEQYQFAKREDQQH